MPSFQRGEIWTIDLGMVSKVRPALILSVAAQDHERALVAYVPRTTASRGTRFEVSHQSRGFDPGVFDAQGIGSIPYVKLVRRIGSVDPTTLWQVESAVRAWLGLAGENQPE
jgi:mRNA interferase MazF